MNIGKKDFCKYDEIQDLGRGGVPWIVQMGLNKRFLYKGPWRKEVGGAESGRRHTREAEWSDDALEDGRRGHKPRNAGDL